VLLTVSYVLPVVVLFLLTNTLASLAGMSLGLGCRAIIAVAGTVALAVAVTNSNWSNRLSSH
jgi:NSS family neurotransmitter:Na+ symporter